VRSPPGDGTPRGELPSRRGEPRAPPKPRSMRGSGFDLKACIHPVMSNGQSEKIISAGQGSVAGKNGRFLLRRREQKSEYVLTLVFKDKVTQHLVAKNDAGLWTVNKKAYGNHKALPAMVMACAKDPLPKGWPVKLSEGVTTGGKVAPPRKRPRPKRKPPRRKRSSRTTRSPGSTSSRTRSPPPRKKSRSTSPSAPARTF